MYLQWYKKDY